MNPGAKWSIRLHPFQHIVASSVLDLAEYRSVASAFARIRDGQDPDPSVRMTRSTGKYDALTYGVHPNVAPRFRPFFEKPWLDLLAELLGISVVPAIDAGLHHVPRGSSSGWVHNDCCSAWFHPSPSNDGLLFPDRRMCDYFTGQSKRPDACPQEYVRAATMIFYLDNDGWRAGMGGETGLYPGSRAALGGRVLAPPVSNTLVLFECTPHSYHRLVANPGCTRNSIILWLHSTVDEATRRWGSGITRRGPE